MSEVRIAKYLVGDEQPCFIVAEIGINHNGDLEVAKRLISVAVAAGCKCGQVPEAHRRRRVYRRRSWPGPARAPLARPTATSSGASSSASGNTGRSSATARRSTSSGSPPAGTRPRSTSSTGSIPPCYKIASASLTDDNLLRHTRSKGKPIILSTGMSTLEQIDHAVEVLGTQDLVLLHACSTYPAPYNELNLRVIASLRDRYRVPVGYSGHETGLPSTIAAVALGASMVERHITLDRAMWGTDQAASLEPNGINAPRPGHPPRRERDGRRRQAGLPVARCRS